MKYLIEIHHGIGDIVQMTGVVEALYQKDKEAQIDLIINKHVYADIFKNDDRISSFFVIGLQEMSKIALFREVWKMRKEKYDYFFASCISSRLPIKILSFFVCAKHSYGEQLGNVLKLDAHRVVRNAQLLKSCGLCGGVVAPKLCGLENEKFVLKKQYSFVFRENDKVVGLCLGTARPAKDWTNEKFYTLAKCLSDEGFTVFLFGRGEKNSERFSAIKNCYSFVDKLNLLEMAAMMTECDVVVGGL